MIKASGIARAAGAVTGLAALELSELVARISEWQQIDDAEGRLWAGIGANMPTAHRVKAAFALLLVAEQNEQRALAERIYVALLDLIEGSRAGDSARF